RIRQRKARGAVIKGRRRPRGRNVTGRAVRNRKYRGGRRVLRVSGLLPGRQMAAGISASIWRRRQVVIVVDVAGRASNSRVRPGQRKVCWRPGVIKGRADPAVKRVTHLAVLRKLAGHVIRIGGLLEIRPVTGNAGGGQPLELAHGRTLVAVLTLHRGMGTEQRKAVLVFLHLLYGGVPALHCVALRAVRAHLSLVHIGVAVLAVLRSEEHTSELQSRFDIVCRLLLEKKNKYDLRRHLDTMLAIRRYCASSHFLEMTTLDRIPRLHTIKLITVNLGKARLFRSFALFFV